MAERLRQQVLPEHLKTIVASYLTPKTKPGILDRALDYSYQRLKYYTYGVNWIFLQVRSGIEIEAIRRSAPTGQPGYQASHYYLNVQIKTHNAILGYDERQACMTEILPLTEASVIQILYIIRYILTEFALEVTPELSMYQENNTAKLRRVTMLRALDVVKPSPSTEKMLSFIKLFRP
jgi:hypothetical protein